MLLAMIHGQAFWRLTWKPPSRGNSYPLVVMCWTKDEQCLGKTQIMHLSNSRVPLSTLIDARSILSTCCDMFGESIVEPELNTCFELFLCLVHLWAICFSSSLYLTNFKVNLINSIQCLSWQYILNKNVLISLNGCISQSSYSSIKDIYVYKLH
jgi:hypothetical protein